MKPILNEALFWDVNSDEIDFEKNARWVIARVLMRGDIEDWYEIKKYYGIEKIKEEIVQVKYLDKLTFNFCHKIFDIEKEKFRCYTTMSSQETHWDY